MLRWQSLSFGRSRLILQREVTIAIPSDSIAADPVDYVLQLRDQIRLGSAANDYHDGSHYLDLVAYWKEQCRGLQDERDNLRRENNRLERSNHMLTNRSSCTPDIAPANAMNTSKRKAQTASPTRNVKRLKGNQQVEHSAAETQEGIDDDFDFLDGLGQGKPQCCSRISTY